MRIVRNRRLSQRAERIHPGYWAAPGLGPFAVPVERSDVLHDGYEPIRRRRAGEPLEPRETLVVEWDA